MGLRSRIRGLFNKAEDNSHRMTHRLDGVRHEVSKIAIDVALEGINFTQKALNRFDKTAHEIIENSKEKAEKLKEEINTETQSVREVAKEQYQKTKEMIQEKMHDDKPETKQNIPDSSSDLSKTDEKI